MLQGENQIKLRVDGARVGMLMRVGGKTAAGFMPWQAAQECARVLRELLKTALPMLDSHVPLDGRPVYFTFDRELAQMLADALHEQGHRAEENAKAEQVILDSAILSRAGIPIGLTNDPKKLALVGNEMVHNRTIRRSALGGIAPTEVWGTPGIKHSRTLQ